MSRTSTGILTLSSSENYGAVLQCHSLCKYLNDNYSDTEIIDFVPDFIIGRYPLISLNKTSFGALLFSIIISFIEFPLKFLKRIRFNHFRYIDSRYSNKKYIKRFRDDLYDQYIVGGDQVFNLKLTNYDQEFFLLGLNNKKSTYAASFGVDVFDEKCKSLLAKGLDSFEYISIREKTGCNLLRDLLPQKEVVQLIDPVFLNDKKYWSNIASKRIIKNEYILLYIFVEFELAYEIAKELKIDNNDLEIVLINDSYSKMRTDVRNIKAVGPKQFLSLIKNAECIITDSFHGTAFSIIFNKQFYSIPYKGTESRINDMLELFNLKNRIVTKYTLMDKSIIDYSNFENQLETQLSRTKEYFDRIYCV